MSTEFYRQDTNDLLGVRTFEKSGQLYPRTCFTWAVNPVVYLWDAGAHFVLDEHGTMMDRTAFVIGVVGSCEVQRYDEKERPS